MALVYAHSPLVLPAFKYKAINEHDAIRLILLQPAADISARLECSIEHVNLSQYNEDLINHYTALSYVWGDATEKRDIVVDGCSLSITGNLDSALRHIRHTKDIIKIWADAICINQEDIQERGQQVQQMGTIYFIAVHTIIYLGEASAEIDDVLTLLSSVSTAGQTLLYLDHETSTIKNMPFETITNTIQAHILNKAWFNRVWVFQELLLSRDPWVQCGSNRVRWTDLCQLSRLASTPLLHQKPIRGSVFGLHNPLLPSLDSRGPRSSDAGYLEDMDIARREFQNYVIGHGEGNSLLALLTLRRGLGVTDARDMIYAHLGIATDNLTGNNHLKVDYQKPFLEVFTDIARYFLWKYNDFSILTCVEDDSVEIRRKRLPTWVPDWTSSKGHNLSDLPDNENQARTQTTGFHFFNLKDGKVRLKCKGTILAQVQIVGGNNLCFDDFSMDPVDAWNRSMMDVNLTESEWVADTDSYYRLIKELETFAGLSESRRNLSHIRGMDYPSCRDTFKTFKRIFRRMWSEEHALTVHPLALFCTLPFNCFLPYTDTEASLGELGSAHAFRNLLSGLRALNGRRLCFCGYDFSKGVGLSMTDTVRPQHLALVPQWTQGGDLICQMYGDSRYVVLRPVESRASLRRSEFIGMCYFNPPGQRRNQVETTDFLLQ